MDKCRKILFAVALITMVAVSAGLVLLNEANITYGFNVDYEYRMDGDKWVTVDYINEKQINGTFIIVECKNYGYFQGSFALIVTFTNATLAATTSEPYEQTNSTIATITYQLHANEARSTKIYFTINGNAKSFLISLSFKSSQIFLRSRESNWLGINTLYYEHKAEENRFGPIMVQ